jgi:hypothetical protein
MFVLAAEFDIEKGSNLSFQYPEGSTDDDPAMLAELMLPGNGIIYKKRGLIYMARI